MTSDRPKPTPSNAMISDIGNWLMRQALEETDIETVVLGCCERLRAAGVPLGRGYFAFTMLHPLQRAIGITWYPTQGTTTQGYPHVPGGLSDTFARSPHYHMLQHDLDHLRAPLNSETATLQFPVLDDLREEGSTDYLAFVVGFGARDRAKHPEGFGMIGSWATSSPSGFSDEEINALLRIEERLAVACKLAVKRRLMRSVTETYLGVGATEHVLDGQIRRGDGQSIKAAIWYSDMRDSSVLADRLPRQTYIDTLNAYFDVTGGAVHDAGGEILSFIGDALLAIFPTDGSKRSTTEACKRAYGAAMDARNRLGVLNKERARTKLSNVEFGTALHLGEVMYGNVGVAERLTFSVFGAAINEVARMESLTKELGHSVLLSQIFTDTCRLKLTDVGCHSLHGIDRDMCLYAPEPAQTQGSARHE